MPAYATPFFTHCQWQYCARTAKEEVYDTWNGYRGRYCLTHAKRLVRELNAPCPGDNAGAPVTHDTVKETV